MVQVKNRYDEVFSTEIEGWCYGVSHYQGEVHPAIISRVIKELSVSFRAAIEHYVAFDILDVAQKFSKAAKYLVSESEIAFAILIQLPNPDDLDADGQQVLNQVVDQVEQSYGGALAPLQKKWRWERERGVKAKAA